MAFGLYEAFENCDSFCWYRASLPLPWKENIKGTGVLALYALGREIKKFRLSPELLMVTLLVIPAKAVGTKGWPQSDVASTECKHTMIIKAFSTGWKPISAAAGNLNSRKTKGRWETFAGSFVLQSANATSISFLEVSNKLQHSIPCHKYRLQIWL